MKDLKKVYYEGWGWGIHFKNRERVVHLVRNEEELKYSLDVQIIDNLDYIEALALLKGLIK
jgi:uncharacterized protein YqgQ